MYQKLVSLNDDLRRLVEKGYAVAIDSGYLVVRDIPYLDQAGGLQIGAFVTKMVFIDQSRVQQEDHQVFFAGSSPHELDGQPVANLGGGPTTLTLSTRFQDVVVQRSFSNKPVVTGRFEDFFAKVESYTALISGPAMERHGVSPYTFRSDTEDAESGVFKLTDSMSSRAEIVDLSDLFVNEVVAIIGLGGTGSYVLDFMVKTPVREIRGFDVDAFHVHNAYRSPGRLSSDELGKPKAVVYAERYDNFRHGLKIQAKRIDASCVEELEGVTFAFVCVDTGSSRTAIFDLLIAMKIPFIDVGMGLKRKNGSLAGQARVTYYPPEKALELRALNLAEMHDGPEDMYRTNIQIGEFNALNATLAVTLYKQLRGFYFTEAGLVQLLFRLSDMNIICESAFDEIPS